jgi:hypothetical protein
VIYKMTNISKTRRIASILVLVATLAGVLNGASTAGREDVAFAFQDFKASAHDIDGHNKQVIELPTNLVQNTLCKTTGENSPIHASCTNTATVITSKTGGVGTVRGSTGDDRTQLSEEPTITGGAVCETAGENSPILASCTNTATVITSKTGGVGTVRGSTGDDRTQLSEEPTITGGAVCETAGENSPIRASCNNTSGTIISNIGGSSTITGGSSTITGGSSISIAGSSSTFTTGSIKLPFGGFP